MADSTLFSNADTILVRVIALRSRRDLSSVDRICDSLLAAFVTL